MFWDIRMIELKIRRGEVSLKEWQAYLDQLPDTLDKATVCKAFEEPKTHAPMRSPTFLTSSGLNDSSDDFSEIDSTSILKERWS